MATIHSLTQTKRGNRRLIYWDGGGMIFNSRDIEGQQIACDALKRVGKTFRFKWLTNVNCTRMAALGAMAEVVGGKA